MNRKKILNTLTSKNFILLFSLSTSILNLIKNLILQYQNIENSLTELREILNNHIFELCINHNKNVDHLKIIIINYIFGLQTNHKKFFQDLKNIQICNENYYEELKENIDLVKKIRSNSYKKWEKFKIYTELRNQINYQDLLSHLVDKYDMYKNTEEQLQKYDKMEINIIKNLIKKNKDLKEPLTFLHKTINKYINDICNDYENIENDLWNNFLDEKFLNEKDYSLKKLEQYTMWLDNFELTNKDKNLAKLIKELNLEVEKEINDEKERLKIKNELIFQLFTNLLELRPVTYSVTRRITTIKQPYKNYINNKAFKIYYIDDGKDVDFKKENINPSIVGLAVEYLTHFMLGAPVNEAFYISLLGVKIFNKNSETLKSKKLLSNIRGLDDNSIISSCKLAGYDVCYRASVMSYKAVKEPNAETIENIRIMVNRSLNFWKKYGPIIKEGFTFDGGYTDIISTGDGDFLTKDTLWDFKVSKNEPISNNSYTLQLLIYYVMGCHSIHQEFKKIKNIGFFNPRLNKIYIIPISTIPKSIIDEIATEIIGYNS